MAEREDGCWEIVKHYTGFINDRPALLSLLYDVDMLPEQCYTVAGAIRLAALCDVWEQGEKFRLPIPADDARGVVPFE